MKNGKFFIACVLFTIGFGCGKKSQTNSESKWALYDVIEDYPYSLINLVDSGEIRVYVQDPENLLLVHIAEAIKMWTAPLPLAMPLKVNWVASSRDADLVVQIIPPLNNLRQHTVLGQYQAPIINLYPQHDKRVLLHEMGHAFGMADTYEVYHDGITGELTSTCDFVEGQPESIMCLGRPEYRLYEDDINGILQLYYNR